jgi:hypothetical protein
LHTLFQENLLPLFSKSSNTTMAYRGQRWWWCVLLWVGSGGSDGGDVVLATAAADNGPQQQQRELKLEIPIPFSRDGTLRFSEIMIYPLSASLNTTRWFELYNTGNNTVALDGLEFTTSSDSSFKRVTLNTTKSIAPFGYAIVGNNNDTATNGNVVVDVYAPDLPVWPSNASGVNAIGLGRHDDFLWGNAVPAANFTFEPGASLARVSNWADPGVFAQWQPSTTLIHCGQGCDKGTPGINNTVIATCPPTLAPTRAPTTESPTASPKATLTTNAPAANVLPVVAPTHTPVMVTMPSPQFIAIAKTPAPAPASLVSGAPQSAPVPRRITNAPSLRPVTRAPVVALTKAPASALLTTASPVAGGSTGSCRERCWIYGVRMYRVTLDKRCLTKCRLFFSLRNDWQCGPCPSK